MHKDIIQYSPTARGMSPLDIRLTLPEHLRNLLLEGERFEQGLCVATCDDHAITQLDEYFQLGKTLNFVKWRHVEISKREIEAFSHFVVSPRVLFLDRDLKFEILRPTCHLEECPWGSAINGPIHVSEKAARRLGIAEVGRPWQFEIELLFSETLGRALENMGATGISGLECSTYGAQSEEVKTAVRCADLRGRARILF